MLCSFIEVLYCILTGLQGNGTLFVIAFTILFTIPACPQHKKYLPDRIHSLAHPQCRSEVVARLQIFVVECNTLFPVFQDAALEEMTPSNKVLVGKGIIDGLVEYANWIRIICWKLWDMVRWQIFEPSFKGRHDTNSHGAGVWYQERCCLKSRSALVWAVVH